ncbi:MAG: hypothetical protein DHS20C07_17380 [Methyloligella sp.]|nr:MAG: hypothetical protein DHS20C07_17380 [Methyloligella sp.]
MLTAETAIVERKLTPTIARIFAVKPIRITKPYPKTKKLTLFELDFKFTNSLLIKSDKTSSLILRKND